MHKALPKRWWDEVRFLADEAARCWSLPDNGRTRDEIREVILQEGFNQKIGAFTQLIGGSELEATALTIPLLGLLPATDERVTSTITQIKEKLSANGLVYRYLTDDGLPVREATFGICSFWLVGNLALAGRIDEARNLFERLTRYAGKLHLFSEQVEPESGKFLGNYPQGFTHLALIRSAFHIAKAEAIGAESVSHDSADRTNQMEQSGRLPSATELWMHPRLDLEKLW